ncbi:MAG: BBP7 family outer membrane beta-barrel protein [Gemmataceae bacterium]
MKKGLWIGGLVLAVLMSISPLRAADVTWQAVGDSPRTQAPAATLAAPVALQASAVAPASLLMPLPGAIQPVSYETAIPVEEPPSRKPTPEIIAVSAPLTVATPPANEEQEEPFETLFAVDRPFRTASSGRVFMGGIQRTSAGIVVPAVETEGVPMVPGWQAPVDTSWGVGLPTGPLAEGLDTPPFPNFNPLRPRLYVSGEYLLWFIQGQSVPVLATTSSPSDFGVLGAPTTQVLFGGNQIGGNSPFSGGQYTAGYWLGCDQTKAVEITGFFLGTRSTNFTTNTSMNPVIGRPFEEANNGQETAQLTSLPQVATGSLNIHAPTSLWGLGANYRCLLCCGCNYRITALAGFRNINLDESLSITENIQGLSTAPQPFTNQMITVNDSFATQNHFYGGNLGVDARYYWGRWSVDVRGQVALGDNVQILDINGSQRFVSPTGVVQNFSGGLLALPSNIGHFTNNAFSVVPQIGLNLGYQILPNLRAFVGYNFLYWSNVIRPGTSIDRVLDVTQIPNFPLNPEPAPVAGQNPAPVFHVVGLWAQGISFGLQFLY